MLEQWRGTVNVLIDKDGKCEICNERHDLIWGLISGQCRCSYCHAEYDLMDENLRLITTPKSLIRTKYKQAIVEKFNSLRKPLSFWNEDDWDSVIGKEGL